MKWLSRRLACFTEGFTAKTQATASSYASTGV